MTSTEAILKERQGTHGSFSENAAVSQALKDVIRYRKTYAALTWDQRESIDMICLKLSRIMSGNPDEPDHWRDIAGYATLVAKRLEEPKPVEASKNDSDADADWWPDDPYWPSSEIFRK
jgi:hypothetical protein